MKKYAVIMAGGSGTRFWPRSSQKNPKQFLKLTSNKSMIQETYNRLAGVVPPKNRWVICTKAHKAAVKKHLGNTKVLAEPSGRNTMAAACWTAWEIASQDPEACVVLLPADAYIKDPKQYQKVLSESFEVAHNNNSIVCIGIPPTYPATAYGYIETTEKLDKTLPISRFVEKPNEEKAKEFFDSGRFAWNAGIFVFKAGVFVNEVQEHAPEFFEAFSKAYFKKPKSWERFYNKLPSQPVDVALMEKTNLGAVVPGVFGWNDVGSWPALTEVLGDNFAGGQSIGPAEVLSLESEGNMLDLPSKKFIGLIGVKDLIVVETKDSLLVCHKDKAQDIKKIISHLGSKKKLKAYL